MTYKCQTQHFVLDFSILNYNFHNFSLKMVAEEGDNNVFRGFMDAVFRTVDAPVTWFRGKLIAVFLLRKLIGSHLYQSQ